MAKKKGNNYIIDEENQLVRIELKRRGGKESLWTIIDLEDFDKVINFPYTWWAKYSWANQSYYAMASEHLGMKENGTQKKNIVALHQFVLDTDKTVDHIEHDTLDNRKSKLRIVETKDNLKNRKGRNSNNKSGYRNVSWDGYKWVVQLQINGKGTALARFPKDQLEEAGRFAEEMRKKYYGEFAGSN